MASAKFYSERFIKILNATSPSRNYFVLDNFDGQVAELEGKCLVGWRISPDWVEPVFCVDGLGMVSRVIGCEGKVSGIGPAYAQIKEVGDGYVLQELPLE